MKPMAKAAPKIKIGADEARKVCCPFCKGFETELYSLFGSQLSTSQYYCRHCRVAFEAIKWADTNLINKAEPEQ